MFWKLNNVRWRQLIITTLTAKAHPKHIPNITPIVSPDDEEELEFLIVGVKVGGLGLTDGWDDGLNECVDDGGVDVGNTIREIKRCEI